eukprot:Em0001g2078a
MAAIKSLLLVLSCVIGVSKCSQVAVIILEQSFACNPAYYIPEGNNATACATIIYTYGNLPLATNISVLFNTTNGTALMSEIVLEPGCANLLYHAWYLDDGVVAGSSTEIEEVGALDPQVALMLLRTCSGFCKLSHLARATPPSLSVKSLELFDQDVLSWIHLATMRPRANEGETQFIAITCCECVCRFLPPGSPTCQARNVFVHNWSLGKPAAFDFYGTSPLNSLILSEAGVSSGVAAQASEIRKHNSNDAKCVELGPKDYGAVSEVRVFTEGSVEGQSLCVTVTTVDDSIVEGTETFQITLSANSPNVTIGDRAGGVTFTVNVNDNDVGYDTYGGGGIGFSSGSPIGSVSCGDYYIVDDNRVENNEDFTIILGGWYRTVVTSSNNTVHVTIIDNDIALIGLRNGNPTTTPETDTMLSVCIALTNAVILDIPINVDFEAISGTATSKLK